MTEPVPAEKQESIIAASMTAPVDWSRERAYNEMVEKMNPRSRLTVPTGRLVLDSNKMEVRMKNALQGAYELWEKEKQGAQYLTMMMRVRNDLIRVGYSYPADASDEDLISAHTAIFKPVWWRYLYAKSIVTLRKIRASFYSSKLYRAYTYIFKR